MSYNRGNTQIKESNWLKSKLRKALTWDQYLDLTLRGLRYLKTKNKTSIQAKYRYEVENYIDENNNIYNINNKEDLLKIKNKIIWKDCDGPIILKYRYI